MPPNDDSLPPDVLDDAGYSESSKGPASDTTAFITGTPLGSFSRGEDTPLVTFDAERRPEQEILARDKLTHTKVAAPPEREGLARPVRMAILAGLVVLSLAAVFSALLFSAGSEPVVAPSEGAEVPATPETPREVGGVPVERGMNRKPLPPKQK